MIIEEAAGVAKFRGRRKEAEGKMESPRQNLARVKDILDEVRRQIGALERQVRKAERYKMFRAELKDLDLRVASRRRLAMTFACDSAREALGGIEDALLSARSGLARMDAGREEARVTLAGRGRLLSEPRGE